MNNNTNRTNKDMPQLFSHPASIDLIAQLRSVGEAETQDLKLKRINQLNNYVTLTNERNQYSEFTLEVFKELLKLISKEELEIKIALLGVISAITEIGADVVQQFKDNIFSKIFDQSGLQNKIEEIFIQQLKYDRKDIKEAQYSNFTILLAQIFAFINKHQHIEQATCEIYGKVLISRIEQLIENMKHSSEILKKNQKQNNEIDDKLKNEIIIETKSLKSIQLLAEFGQNNLNLTDQQNFHEIIAPLIHINCPSQLRCKQRISLPEISAVLNLHSTAFRLLGDLIYCNNNAKEHLIKNHKIFEHISLIIINFAKMITNQNRKFWRNKSTSSVVFLTPQSNSTLSLSKTSNSQNSTQSLNFSQSSSSLKLIPSSISNKTSNLNSSVVIDGIIHFLFYLILDNSPICQRISQNIQLLQSLLELTQFNKKIYQGQNNDRQSAKIRENCKKCLVWIWHYGSEKQKYKLITTFNIVMILILGIGVCGGNEESNYFSIKQGLICIKNIFIDLNEQIEYKINANIKQLMKEHVEQEGGIEEIESHYFNSRFLQDDDISINTFDVKKEFGNIMKNRSI